MTEGYSELVDRLMSLEGYDREDAELVASARLGVSTKTVREACRCDCGDCDPGDCNCECGTA